jgi:hypothetical protein
MTRVGWLLFLIGSVAFAVNGIRVGDTVAAVASVLFVVGVVAFLLAEREAARCPVCGRTEATSATASPAPAHGSNSGRCDAGAGGAAAAVPPLDVPGAAPVLEGTPLFPPLGVPDETGAGLPPPAPNSGAVAR